MLPTTKYASLQGDSWQVISSELVISKQNLPKLCSVLPMPRTKDLDQMMRQC